VEKQSVWAYRPNRAANAAPCVGGYRPQTPRTDPPNRPSLRTSFESPLRGDHKPRASAEKDKNL